MSALFWRNLLIVFTVPTILTTPKCVCVLFFLLLSINVVLRETEIDMCEIKRRVNFIGFNIYIYILKCVFLFHSISMCLYSIFGSFCYIFLWLDLAYVQYLSWNQNRTERERERAVLRVCFYCVDATCRDKHSCLGHDSGWNWYTPVKRVLTHVPFNHHRTCNNCTNFIAKREKERKCFNVLKSVSLALSQCV